MEILSKQNHINQILDNVYGKATSTLSRNLAEALLTSPKVHSPQLCKMFNNHEGTASALLCTLTRLANTMLPGNQILKESTEFTRLHNRAYCTLSGMAQKFQDSLSFDKELPKSLQIYQLKREEGEAVLDLKDHPVIQEMVAYVIIGQLT